MQRHCESLLKTANEVIFMFEINNKMIITKSDMLQQYQNTAECFKSDTRYPMYPKDLKEHQSYNKKSIKAL